jgi:hypothetical protein
LIGVASSSYSITPRTYLVDQEDKLAPTAKEQVMASVEHLAHAVLFPSLGRSTVPRWIKDPLTAGLGGFVLFGREATSADQLRGLTGDLRALAPAMHIAVD